MSDEAAAIQRACTTCIACLKEDYGYSNYTVEGTELHCLRGLNPALGGQEEPYREVTPELAAILDVALTCPQYKQGAPAQMDCDHEMDLKPYGENRPHTVADVRGCCEDDEIAGLLAAYLDQP